MAWRYRMEEVESKLDASPDRVLMRNASAPYISCERTSVELATQQPSNSRRGSVSPYVQGRKNSNYVNPTFQSSGFLDASSENINNTRDQSQNYEGNRNLVEENPSRGISVKGILRSQSGELSQPRRDSLSRGLIANGDVRSGFDPKIPTFGHIQDDGYETAQRKSSRKFSVEKSKEDFHPQKESNQALDACNGCYNLHLKDEKDEREVREIEYSRELDRKNLDYARQLHEKSADQDETRRISIQKIARHNLNILNKKKALQAQSKIDSQEAYVKNLHKNMIEKMFEDSDRRYNQKSEKAKQSLTYNIFKSQINEEKKAVRNEDFHEKYITPEKSFVDKMHDTSATQTRQRSAESRQTYQHNLNCSVESSLLIQNFEKDSDTYEQNSYQYLRARKQINAEEKPKTSFINLKQHLRDQEQRSDESTLNQRAKSTGKFRSTRPNTANDGSYISTSKPEQSLLGKLYSNDEKDYNRRRENSRECLRYNQQEANFFREDSQKDINYDLWADHSQSINHKLNQGWQKQEQERENQKRECKISLRKQIEEKIAKSREQEIKKAMFQEKPLLVCSHKVSVSCCGLCNRKVPSKTVSQLNVQKKPSKINTNIAVKRR